MLLSYFSSKSELAVFCLMPEATFYENGKDNKKKKNNSREFLFLLIRKKCIDHYDTTKTYEKKT